MLASTGLLPTREELLALLRRAFPRAVDLEAQVDAAFADAAPEGAIHALYLTALRRLAAARPAPAEVIDRSAPRSLDRAPPQLVSLGFAAADAPDTPLVDRTLASGEWHVFWVDIRRHAIAGAVDGATPIDGLRDGDLLDVILFGFPAQLRLGADRHGRIRIGAPTTRLRFAVRTPWRSGRHALRCNVYHRGVLLQSHLVTAAVTWSARAQPGALHRVCDYNLSARLDTARLGPGSEHLLSVLVNDDGRGTHGFRFVTSKAGVPDQIADGHLDGAALAEVVDHARKALQWIAWGTEAEWTERDAYRFATRPSPATLERAYLTLAVRGANLWGQIITQFGVRGPGARALREAMRAPGRVQIALKASPDAVVPMAIIYDYPLDPARGDLQLCPDGLAARADAPCFRGECPRYDDDRVVCLGGFWGFRHELGLPIHLPGGEVATTIARGAAVRGFAPISTDPAFVLRADHLAALARLAPDWLEVIDDRDRCIARLVEEARPIVYFYCHGGVTDQQVPFLEVGPRGSDAISAQTLINKFLHWTEPTRPLVILNGCHTTATSPRAMFSLLSALAAHGNAAGVIGTEITNFEPIAVQFGAELLRRFLDGDELGHAVKHARLALLAQGNPLGLMYIPFALPTLKLV